MSRTLYSWFNQIIGYFVKTVPLDMEMCEFGCRTLECSGEVWQNCERRKQLISEMEHGQD